MERQIEMLAIELTDQPLEVSTLESTEQELAHANPVLGMNVDDDDAPITALVGRPLHEMSEQELLLHLRTLQEYIVQPARRAQDVKDAQTRILTGKRPSRTTINIKSLL